MVGRAVNTEEGATLVRRLVEGVLTAAGVPFTVVDGCLLADLPAEARTALEGRWAAAAPLCLTFDRASAAAHPEADLVEPGSFRLERFLAWVRRENRLGIAHLAPLPRGLAQRLLTDPAILGFEPQVQPVAAYLLEETQVWEPHLVVGFLAARSGAERRETLHVPGINLVTGDCRRDWSADLPEQQGSPARPMARRRLSYRRAYRALLSSVVDEVEAEDGAWADAARRRYHEEERSLETYYAELLRENRGDPDALAQLEANRQLRLEEQRARFLPRVVIRPVAAALLYAPVLKFTVLLCDGRSETRRLLTYDPGWGKIRSPRAAPRSPLDDPEPRIWPTPPPAPARPQRPGAPRWLG